MQNVSHSRRRFLQTAFAFSAAGLAGCGSGIATEDPISAAHSHFMAIGDWGWNLGTADQDAVADGMQNYMRHYRFEPDGLLLLGDNFYGELPKGPDDSRWKSQFEDRYPEATFNCLAYAVPGNHDYQNAPASKLDAELMYAATGKSRWTMPARYYTFTWPQANPTATFIMLDSNMPDEPAQPPPPNKTYYTQTNEQRLEQLAWLTDQLSRPLLTPFLIVVAHHPIYTNGAHGDNHTLIRDWDPLLRQSKAHLYLAGHDHDLQHLELVGHPTSFVMNGGGGAALNPLRGDPFGPFAEEIHGFTHVQVTAELMTVRHLDAQGNLLHRFTKTPQGVVQVKH